MALIPVVDQTYGFFAPGPVRSFDAEWCERYRTAEPYPHIVLDDVFPAELLDHCLDAFPATAPEGSFSRPQELLKSTWNPDALSPAIRSLFYSFNSRPFVAFLEKLTGIEGLIPDPDYIGGGLHQTTNGGKLDVHVDFNLHPRMRLERRLNVLVYLNKDWREEYGGCFELWNADMSTCVRRVEPIFNRMVVFSTTDTSWHGHPEPIRHPRNMPRRSIALYYYTATWDDRNRSRTTHFRPRPNSNDRPDMGVALREVVREWLVPPGFVRLAKRVLSAR